ncbi:MAG: hypothetical protein A3G34_17510 [Candidatus Lindowbacteria bacterium RIFCSPLOWO2_12_FULL_62_27]|nr:MAG: hypothetical protein A3G34_17510 [Candidatus Lindowbacteria bacterium RIFCSPLOWO2_12_FULL_62_27]
MAGFVVHVLVVLMVPLVPTGAFAGDLIPELVQTRMPAPQVGVNEFVTGPFLEGMTEGNILYLVTNPASSTATLEYTVGDPPVLTSMLFPVSVPAHEFRRTGPSGGLPDLPIQILHAPDLDARIAAHLSNVGPRLGGDVVTINVSGIFAGNGLVYPFLDHAHFFQFQDVYGRIGIGEIHDGNFIGNGPIQNDPGPTTCDLGTVSEGNHGLSPAVLTARLYVPDVLQTQPLGEERDCFTSAYHLNADFTFEFSTDLGAREPHPPAQTFVFTRSTNRYDPVPPDILGVHPDDMFFVDPETGEELFFGGTTQEAVGVFYVARGGPTGAAIVWTGKNQPRFGQRLMPANLGLSRVDLDGRFFQPPVTDPNRILVLSGLSADTDALLEVLQTADRFVLLSWIEDGVAQWGTFKYVVFGRVVSPYGQMPANIEIEARHLQDGRGFYFALDDLQYPFSLVDKQSPHLTIPVDPDGHFARPGLPAGTYELRLRIDGAAVGRPVRTTVTDYRPAILELPAMLGIEADQAFASPTEDAGVNVSNGNLIVQSLDVENVNVGPFLGLVRTFNGMDMTQDLNVLRKDAPDAEPVPLPFGRGWTHNYNLLIVGDDAAYWDMSLMTHVLDTAVILIDEDGTRHTFIRPWPIEKTIVDGRELIEYRQVTGTGAEPMRLRKTSEKRLEMTRKDGTRYTFDILQGRTRIAQLTRIEDPNGNAVDLDYDDEARLTQVVSASTSRTLLFEYLPGSQLITKITDAMGRLLQYLYLYVDGRPDETAKLAGVARPAGDPIEYTYAPAGFMTEVRQGPHQVSVAYDPFNRAISIAPPDGRLSLAYEPSSGIVTNKTSLIDAAGAFTAVMYDPWRNFDLAGQPIGGGRIDAVTDPHNAATTLQWNTLGRPSQIVEANGHAISLEYDRMKNLARWTGSDPVTWTYPDNLDDFDPKRNHPGRLEGISSSPVNFAYNSAGNFLKSESGDIAFSVGRNADGTVSVMTDPARGTTALEYANGNVSRVTTPASTTTLTYGTKESMGLPDKEEGPGGTTLFSYDDAGRPATLRTVGVALGGDESDLVTAVAYDGWGNVTEISSPNGQTIAFEYAASDRLASVQRNVSGVGAVRTDYSFDERGLMIEERRPDGLRISYGYDQLNRPTSMIRGSANPRATSMNYDALGNLTQFSDGAEAEAMTYDPESRLTRHVRASPGLSPLTTNLSYNRRGLITGLTSQGSTSADPTVALSATYDGLNRLTRILAQSGPHAYTSDFVYEAGTGRLSDVQTGDHATHFSYDLAGRVNRIRRESIAMEMEAEYDANNNLTRLGVVGGLPPVERRYNTQGWLLEKKRGDLVENFSYDKAGHIVERRDSLGSRTSRVVNEEGWILSETIDGHTTNFSYDPQGRVTRTVDPDGSVREFSYNEHGDLTKTRTTGVTLGGGSGPQDVVTEIEYDEHGNPVVMRRNNADITTYRWSSRWRVGMTDAEGHVWTYGRDAYGNLTSVFADSALVNTYSYDGFGNRISMTDAQGQTTRYKYDSQGRLIEQADPDGTIITNKYHGSGNLVEQTTRSPSGAVRTETREWAGGEVLTRMTNPEGSVGYQRDGNGHLTGITFSPMGRASMNR